MPYNFLLKQAEVGKSSQYLPHFAGPLDELIINILSASIFSCLIVSALELFNIAPPTVFMKALYKLHFFT